MSEVLTPKRPSLNFSYDSPSKDYSPYRSTHIPQPYQTIHPIQPMMQQMHPMHFPVQQMAPNHVVYLQPTPVYTMQPNINMTPQFNMSRHVSHSAPKDMRNRKYQIVDQKVIYGHPLTFEQFQRIHPAESMRASMIMPRRGSFVSTLPTSHKKQYIMETPKLTKITSDKEPKEMNPEKDTKKPVQKVQKPLQKLLDKLDTKDKDRLLLDIEKELDTKEGGCCGGPRKKVKEMAAQKL